MLAITTAFMAGLFIEGVISALATRERVEN
jgi:hypothetical protein